MSNSNITDWLTFTSATPTRKQKSYVDLPVFSYAAQGNVSDASLLVAQFNFSASRDFYLTSGVSKPANCTFGLCIRFRVGDVVTRYKLWTDDNFILSSDAAPIYNKQLIRANFVLEVWNFGGVAPVNASVKRLFTSVQSVPSDYRTIADYALAVGVEFTNYAPVAPTLPAGATQRWTMVDSNVYPWVDVIGGTQLTSTGLDMPVYSDPDADWLKGNLLFADGAHRILQGVLPVAAWNNVTVYMVASLDPASSFNRSLFELSDYVTLHMGLTNVLRFHGWGTGYVDYTVPDNSPRIIAFSIADTGTPEAALTVQIDDTVIGASLITPPRMASQALTLALGDSIAGGYGNDGAIKLGEVLIYNGTLVPFNNGSSGDPSFAMDTAIKQYLRWYHFGQTPLPVSYDVGVQWLDNVPL